MQTYQISPFQLFCLIFLFELGSSVIVCLGIEALQDAWISILIATVLGVLCLGIFAQLNRYYPEMTLTKYAQSILGKPLGWIVGVLYILYFIYEGSRVVRDISTLLNLAWLQKTPNFIINFLLVLVTTYAVYQGIEALSRTGEIFFTVYFCSLLLGFIIILFSGIINVEKIEPIGENWPLILQTAFPDTLVSPFGQIIVFAMLFPFLSKQKKSLRYGVFGVGFAGLALSFVAAVNIMVTGVNITSRAPFPLLTTMGQVSIPFFLEQLDILTCIILVIGGFFKVAILHFAATLGCAQLFNEKIKHLSIVVGIILLLLSMLIAHNFIEHIHERLDVIPITIQLPLQVGIPLLLLLIALIKKRVKKHL